MPCAGAQLTEHHILVDHSVNHSVFMNTVHQLV